MKELSFARMESLNGGKITEEEVDAFMGAAGCIIAASSLAGAFFGAWNCYKWIKSL